MQFCFAGCYRLSNCIMTSTHIPSTLPSSDHQHVAKFRKHNLTYFSLQTCGAAVESVMLWGRIATDALLPTDCRETMQFWLLTCSTISAKGSAAFVVWTSSYSTVFLPPWTMNALSHLVAIHIFSVERFHGNGLIFWTSFSKSGLYRAWGSFEHFSRFSPAVSRMPNGGVEIYSFYVTGPAQVIGTSYEFVDAKPTRFWTETHGTIWILI